MAADGVEPEDRGSVGGRRATWIASPASRSSSTGTPFLSAPANFIELGERSACDDGDVLVDACGDERRSRDECVNGPRAERLDVTTGGVCAAGLLGDRLA